jgi:hypothetical protein
MEIPAHSEWNANQKFWVRIDFYFEKFECMKKSGMGEAKKFFTPPGIPAAAFFRKDFPKPLP